MPPAAHRPPEKTEMKLPLWFAAITLGTVCWLPTNANAQGGGTTDGVNPNRMPDYYTNPTLADTMIRNRREQRRREERLRQRRDSKRGRRAATDTRRTAARRAGASAVKPAAPLPRYGIEFRRDSYQDFHREDINGFRVNFTFVSVATGKTIPKSGVCQLYDQGDPIEGIPAGVSAVLGPPEGRGTRGVSAALAPAGRWLEGGPDETLAVTARHAAGFGAGGGPSRMVRREAFPERTGTREGCTGGAG